MAKNKGSGREEESEGRNRGKKKYQRSGHGDR